MVAIRDFEASPFSQAASGPEGPTARLPARRASSSERGELAPTENPRILAQILLPENVETGQEVQGARHKVRGAGKVQRVRPNLFEIRNSQSAIRNFPLCSMLSSAGQDWEHLIKVAPA